MKNNQRESGIELLKILSMFLIVMHHVIMSLYVGNEYYTIPLYNVTNDIQHFMLTFCMGGAFR